MSKPILAALGAFTSSSLAVLGVSYLKHEEFAYTYAFTFGVGMAIGMYAVTQWKQQRMKSCSEPNDLSSKEEDEPTD